MNTTVGRRIKFALKILPDKCYLKLIYFLIYKRRLNLNNPKYWTEKMQYKKLYDRNELLPQVADKLKLRQYATVKINTDITPEILWVGDNPSEIPFEKLPNKFVLKTNHGIGTNIIIEDKKTIDQRAIINQLNNWLDEDYFYPERQWAYKNIERKVFVEELLYDGNNQIPSDIKLYMFNGKLGAINLHYDRFKVNHQNILVDHNFKLLHSETKTPVDMKKYRPKKFDDMVVYAEKLADPFDFVRVDFYDLGNDFVLSELTHYPAAGIKRMPKEIDLYLGNLWQLDDK